ncbi:MAG: Flp pilus assembly complex ATPase component TadA [Planctomycetes bacterium]|nr:Flp pilus assembly complex ATPase component TadA [Planctomycetota bacterium]
MRVIAYSQLSDVRQEVDLTGDILRIGRDAANDLELPSPFVSREHARLIKHNGEFFIENVGLNGTLVDGEMVGVGEQVHVAPGQEIHIGEWALYLSAEAAPKAGGEAIRIHRERTPLAKAMEIEKNVHAELLRRLNLRTVDVEAQDDPRYVKHIKAHLSAAIDQFIRQVDDESGWFLVEQQMKRDIITEISRRAGSKMREPLLKAGDSVLDPQYEAGLLRLRDMLIQDLGLQFGTEHVKADIETVEERFHEEFNREAPQVTESLWVYVVRRYIMKDILDIVVGLGPIQDLLDMPNVTEVMVVGPNKIYIEEGGVIRNTGRSFFSEEVVLTVIERIVTPLGRRIDRSTPIVDARLPDGSRVNATIEPLSLVGPVLTIRKFSETPFTIDDLISFGSITPFAAKFLRACVLGRKNILVAGGTASGKTTLLNVLSAFIPPHERIITIEDSAELQLYQEHVVRAETRQANVEGKGQFTIRMLVQNALRQRPDRIIVGEVRGAEALDMLQAMNTGHDGSLTTIHANSPLDAMKRLEGLVLEAVDMPIRAIREQVVTALDVVAHLTRFADGRREVTAISEVAGMDRDEGEIIVEDIFVRPMRGKERGKRGELMHTGYIPLFAQDLLHKGLLTVDAFM